MARGTAHVCVTTARQDLHGLVDLAMALAEHDDAALAPYADDIAEAYEGLCAVDDHLPTIPPTPKEKTS